MYIKQLNPNDIKTQIFEIISNVTGHKTEDLDCEMFLESDLGIDSIKMVTLMSRLMNFVPAEQQADFTALYPITYLISLQTIDEIVRMFEEFYNVKGSNQMETDELLILNAQYSFLASYWSVGTLTICSGVKIEGPQSLDLLQESWFELVIRHPGLCSEFKVNEGAKSFRDYKLKVSGNLSLPEIEVINIINLSAEMKNATIKETIEEILNRPFDIFKYPLHKFMIFQINVTQYELILANNHLASDGLGNQQILREMLEIYSAKIKGIKAEPPERLSVSDYNKVISEINNWNDPEDHKNYEKYLKTYGKTKYRFNPLRKKDAHNEFADVKTQKYWLNETVTKLLLDKSKAWRVSFFTLVVSAYLKSIAQLDGESKSIILNLPTAGKVYPNVDATGLVGCFAQNISLSFQVDASDENWLNIVTKVEEELKEKLSAGIDRAQTRITAQMSREQDMLEAGKMSKTTAALVRSSLKSNLYLSYVGNTHLKDTYGDLKIIDYEAYTSTNAGTIDNLIELFQNRMLITANYDSLHFHKDDIDILISRFLNNLNSLANFKMDFKTGVLKSEVAEDTKLLEELRKIAQEVCGSAIYPEDRHKDLELNFGIDSLQLIRMITRLNKLYGEVDKNGLFGCRTLNEMASIIENNARLDHQNQVLPESDWKNEELLPYRQIMKQCKLTPDAAAIMYDNETITYKELESISNKIANYLINQGIKRGSLVGIMVLPGPVMLMGMLGIMKSGAAYVPVDPAYPIERVQYILHNAGLEVLLTEHLLDGTLSKLINQESPLKSFVYMDEGPLLNSIPSDKQVCREQWLAQSESSPELINSPDDLMTVLYTSGSTGNPKGVMLGHRGYMNRLQWHQDVFQLKQGERVAQKTSCCFDISVWELFWPLMYGGTVCPVRNEIVRNPWNLAKWLIDTKIRIMHFVPSLFGEFVNALEDEDYTFRDLRWLIFSGEALSMPIIQKWIDKHGLSIGLANLYGPTEASIDVTCHIIDKRPGADGENSIPIGKPITNVSIKNLDQDMNELPEGEIGELWLGGIQLAKGYLNNQQKTMEAFKPNPFSDVPGDFLYRTGDLTSRRADGSYIYHGRIDNQIKIRGFRVELGEIEAVLAGHPFVEEVAVLAVESSESQKQLLAWFSGKKATEQQLKEFITKKLPHYMIPHRFEKLNVLPKTPNGKLDRKALHELSRRKTTEDAREDFLVNGVPLSPAQHWLMNYFAYPYQWTGYTRFLYKQPLDYQLFNKALSILTNSRDALRSVLVNSDGKWLQRFLPEDRIIEADFYDGSQMNDQERHTEVQDLIDQVISELKVDQWPLWKVVVIKVSTSLYDISVIGHHLIADVITNQLLFKEIWRIYGQLMENTEVKLEKSKTYREFVLQVDEEKKNKGLEFVDYWKRQFPSELYSFKIPPDFNLGNNTEESAGLETFALEKSETQQLLTTARKYFGTTVYAIILAPLYKMLQKRYAGSWIVVSHRVHGRDLGNDNTFFQTAGNFAINFPLGITIGHNEEWSETVHKITSSLDGVPLKGLSYDLVADHLPAYMYPDLTLTPIRANYLGNRDLPEYEVFEFAKDGLDRRYSHPEQKRISDIECFFSIVRGELNLEIEYSRNMYDASTIRQLGNEYLKATQEMLAYLKKQENPPKTLKPLLLIKENKKHGSLLDKVVIITGGGRGIGKTIAIEMAKEDAQIAIISRTRRELEETAQVIQGLGGKVIYLTADISDYKAVQEAVHRIVSEFGKIDILVNNAAITKMEPFTDAQVDEWKRIVEVNLFGTFNLCHAVVPHFVKQKSGKIINLGSDSSFIGYPLMTAYSASKHAIIGLTKSLAEELKTYNIQVNSICPAFVDTNMAPRAFRKNAMPPEKVAELVIFLSSDKSDYITGEAIKIFGKQDMYWFGSQQIPVVKAVLNQ